MTEQKSQETTNTGKCRAGLAWESTDKVDLDMSVIAFGKTGIQLEVAYYNGGDIYNGNIKHSGDNRNGKKRGDDEYIDIKLETLNREVRTLVFLVNIYDEKKTFQNVKTPKFTLYIDKKSIYQHSFGKFNSNGYLIGALYRNGKVWKFKKFETQCTGKNFSESMPVVIENLIKIPIYDKNILKDIPNNPYKTYDLKKDEIYTFDKNIVKAEITLGWKSTDKLDVDTGVLLLSEKKEVIDKVYFKKLKYNDQIKHSGDKITGVGEGDEETIKLNLYKLDRNICYLGIGVWIQTGNKYFKDIKKCFVRLENHKKDVLCTFNLSDGNYDKAGAVIMGYLFRNKYGFWAFKSCGIPKNGECTGFTPLESPIKQIVKNGKEPNEETYQKIKREAEKYIKQNKLKV